MRERAGWIALTLALAGALLVERRPSLSAAVARPAALPGVRLSMEALHQQGGVPIGWEMTLPPGDVAAGRQAFVDFGCHTCHRVASESFATDRDLPGPDLTGMGAHHPAAYFAEAILNANAVLIEGPGYLGADGRSIMPAYPDMTAGQLSDLVAYLSSLTADRAPSCHDNGGASVSGVTIAPVDLRNRPQQSAVRAQRFFVQTYDVLPGQLVAFEAWFAREGRPRFLAVDGLVSLDTFVDTTRPRGAVTSLFGFRDEAALRNFLGDPAMADLWKQFDAFIGPHGHQSYDRPSLYRAVSLSAE